MTRTQFRSFMTGSLVFGALPVLFATVAQAQAPSRTASGSYYEVSSLTPSRGNSAVPPRSGSSRPSADSDYRAASLAPVPSGGYYYPDQRPATPPPRDYYAPTAGYSTRAVPATRVAPAPSRVRPSDLRRIIRPDPKPADVDTYAYKS